MKNHPNESAAGAEPTENIALTANFGSRAKPDWLSDHVFEALTAGDEKMQSTVQQEVVYEAQCILSWAYYKRLRELVPPLLPSDIHYLSEESATDCPDVFYSDSLLAKSCRELEAAGERCAADDAYSEAEYTLQSWMRSKFRKFAVEHGYDPEGDVSLFMTLANAAVIELKEARAAYDCAAFWIRLQTSKPPPDWRQVQALIREHPELVTIGPAEMLKRGFVLPPWLVAWVS